MNVRLVGVFFLVGCGGTIANGSDASTPDGSDASSTGCPVVEPSPAAACAVEGLQCEYGNADRFTCNDVATCTQGAWSVTIRTETCTQPTGCPTNLGEATGDCSAHGLICDYSTPTQTEFCTCGIQGGPVLLDGGASWACQASLGNGNCPLVRPHIGDACTAANAMCAYDICGEPTGLSFQCDAATMTWVKGPQEFCG